MKKIGIIYKATNIADNKVYIGATRRPLKARRWDHENEAKNHPRRYFQQAIATFGPESFTWEQIDTANDVNELSEKEKKYIIEYNAKDEGYNRDNGGGIKKVIYQYAIDTGKLIDTHYSLAEAAESISSDSKRISKICLSVNQRLNDFYWSYEFREPYTPRRDLRKKRVMQFSLDNNHLAIYDSASEAARQTGYSKSCISRCCRGEREQTGGFLWKYI